jgi:hypothetical protein
VTTWRVALLLAASLAAACHPTPPKQAAEMDRLVARCVDAMTREACVAQRDRNAAAPATAGQVFVAGVGAIDAQAYREIRDAGEAMCGLVRNRCE